MTKTAILFGGSAYNIRFSLQSQLDNLIIPNNADVFIVTTRACRRRRTPEGEIATSSDNDKWVAKTGEIVVDKSSLTNSELQLIRETFGDRLKILYVAEENADYVNYLDSERRNMMNTINSYIDESLSKKLPPPFAGNKLDDSYNGNIRCVVDQYRHIAKCYELMEQYEKDNNFKYHYVMRARIDFIVPEKILIEHYAINHDGEYLYCFGNFGTDHIEWGDEYAWFSRRIIAAKLFPNLNKMGLLHDRKYTTISGSNDMMFDPEVQFPILVRELKLSVVVVKIWRSARFTNGGDGYDYFNYMFSRALLNIEYEYRLVCECQSDINEHCPKLKEYAEKCDHVTEIGVRYGNSTVALMAARSKYFVSYDVNREPKVDYIELIAKESGVNWELRILNPTDIENNISHLEETDLLFIDTTHNVDWCSEELRLHAHKVRKYLIFHDTTTFWNQGQGYDHGGGGLKLAIEPFLEDKKDEWKMIYRTEKNNGLMILERINS